jgi:hypothetical protein
MIAVGCYCYLPVCCYWTFHSGRMNDVDVRNLLWMTSPPQIVSYTAPGLRHAKGAQSTLSTKPAPHITNIYCFCLHHWFDSYGKTYVSFMGCSALLKRRWTSTWLNGATFQKTLNFILAAVRTWSLAWVMFVKWNNARFLQTGEIVFINNSFAVEWIQGLFQRWICFDSCHKYLNTSLNEFNCKIPDP